MIYDINAFLAEMNNLAIQYMLSGPESISTYMKMIIMWDRISSVIMRERIEKPNPIFYLA